MEGSLVTEDVGASVVSPNSQSSTPSSISTVGGNTPQQRNNTPGLDSQDEGETYCNPEPPPEISPPLLNADNIGGTVFSKHWLFTVLMKLIQAVDGQENSKEQTEPGHNLDIDDALQDELCKLWDMSMNSEVVSFLQEFKALDILTGVIAKSRAPRATEICVGILGNMACTEEVCMSLSQSDKLRELLLVLLQSPDAPTLVELTRLLHVCISSPKASSYWIESIKNEPSVFTHVSFILQSSTNSDLLKSTGDLVDSLLYRDDHICQTWGSTEVVLGVLEAIKQLGSDDLIQNTSCFIDKLLDISDHMTTVWSNAELVLGCLEAVKQVGFHPGSESLETFLHILQLVSTCEPGVEALVSYGSDLIDLTMKYLVSICEEDLVGIDSKENSIGSALSVLNVLLSSWEDRNKFIQEDFQLMRCVLKILEEVFPKFNQETVDQVTTKRQRGESETSNSPPPFSAYISDSQVKVNTPEVTHASSSSHNALYKSPANNLLQVTDKSCDHRTPEPFSQGQGEPVSQQGQGDSVIKSSQMKNSPAVTAGLRKCASRSHLVEDYDKKMTQMLYDVIQTCMIEVTSVLRQVCFPKGLENLTDNTSQEPAILPSDIGIPETLDYLDTKCPSPRIRYLLYILKDASSSEGKDLLCVFKALGQKYHMTKLNRILDEF